MKYVITLIGNPAKRDVTEDAAAEAGKALQATGAATGAPDWLSADIACDLSFDGIAPGAADAAVRRAIGSQPVDIVAQSAGGRRKKLLIADMDSTIITVECIDELADFAGKRAEISAITERAMRGELDFEQALRERAAMLNGLPESAMAEAFEQRVALTPGARALVMTMREAGAYTALVSGGFDYFTARVRQLAGFDMDRANSLEITDGRLTGRVAEPILGRMAKLETLKRLMAEHGLSVDATLAVGDGANDLDMVRAAGTGVAYHAKPIVAEAAGARIDHGDLTALLFLQGYRAADFSE